MKQETRNVIQAILASDLTVTSDERAAVKCALQGKPIVQEAQTSPLSGPIWLKQQQAAKFLAMSRWTLSRIAKNGEPLLQPVEVLPGTYRYVVAYLRRYAEQRMEASRKASASQAPFAA